MELRYCVVVGDSCLANSNSMGQSEAGQPTPAAPHISQGYTASSAGIHCAADWEAGSLMQGAWAAAAASTNQSMPCRTDVPDGLQGCRPGTAKKAGLEHASSGHSSFSTAQPAQALTIAQPTRCVRSGGA